MIALTLRDDQDSRFPGLQIRRLCVDVQFERAPPDGPVIYYQAAFIDTGSLYLVVPHKVHARGHFRIRRALGRKAYRILSDDSPPLLQPFAEIGIRFLAKDAAGKLVYEPEQFLTVKAYLLDPKIRPLSKVLIGLEPLTENFLMQVAKGEGKSFLTPAADRQSTGS